VRTCIISQCRTHLDYAITPRKRYKQVRHHRLVFEECFGFVKKGNHIHHTCETKNCVNPEHIVELTPSEHSTLHSCGELNGNHGKLKEFCLNGHEKNDENTYSFVNKKGILARECKPCRRIRQRAYRSK